MAIKKKPKAKKPTIHQQVAWIDDYFKTKTIELTNLINRKSKEAEVGLVERCKDLEQEVRSWKWQYEDLSHELTSMLSKEQLDAAKICGVTPEFYAIQWVKICKSNNDDLKHRFTIKESWSI